MKNLGKCLNKNCAGTLGVRQLNKFRLQGDQRIMLDENGQDLRQDPISKRLSGRPALSWRVCCLDCGSEPGDQHPYQRELDAMGLKIKAPEPPAFSTAPPAAPAAAPTVPIVNLTERRLAALEADMAEIKRLLGAMPGKKSKGG